MGEVNMKHIQYFPGHHKKTEREILAHINQVDLVAEVIDARIPIASRKPDLDALVGGKPRLIVLNRADQADGAANKVWADYFRSQGNSVIETDCKSGRGIGQFAGACRGILREQIAKWQEKGQVGRAVRAMVVGIPNVGKSSFINRVSKRKSAKAADKPGVTRGIQWVTVDSGLQLMDTPGVLWPKFENQTIAAHLAFTGAINDGVVDLESLSCMLLDLLAKRYPQAVESRYKITIPAEYQPWELLELAGRKRGFLISGGEVDLERMARILLDEYRSGKLGSFTIEMPQDLEQADG